VIVQQVMLVVGDFTVCLFELLLHLLLLLMLVSGSCS